MSAKKLTFQPRRNCAGTRTALGMARHILFTSQKGGVGKSTLARSTAVALASAGRKVLLADFDVGQATCLRWEAQRRARRLEPAIDAEKCSKDTKLDRLTDR